SFAGKASPHLLYAATVFLAFFTSLEQPSRQSMIPSLVPRAQLAQALALQGTQRYVPVIAGPSLAGVVLAIFGPAVCYAVDACSWLAMLAALQLLRTKIPEGGGWKRISLRRLPRRDLAADDSRFQRDFFRQRARALSDLRARYSTRRTEGPGRALRVPRRGLSARRRRDGALRPGETPRPVDFYRHRHLRSFHRALRRLAAFL